MGYRFRRNVHFACGETADSPAKHAFFEGIVYSWVKLKQVESHARVGLKSLSGGPKLSYVIRTTYEKHGQS